MHDYADHPPCENHCEETSLDTYLLRRFVQKGSQIAFAELVRRHSGLVYSTCLREGHDASLAEEAAQAVFLLLARKASSLQRLSSLSGWLFRTARFVSRNALRQERRRQMREQKAAEMAQTRHDAADTVWSRLEPLLNDALASLAPKEQEVILLHYFQDLSWREAADTLAISEDAAQKRCARALGKLRRSVGGAGLVLTVAALTELLAARAAHAVPTPPALASKVAGTPSLHALQLYHGVTHTMTLIKTTAVLGSLALTATAAGLLWAKQPHAPLHHVGRVAAAPAPPTGETPQEMLTQARDHYHRLSSFSMQMVQHDSSGLYPGAYTQQLDWKRGTQTDGNDGQFSLRNLSPGNKALREGFDSVPGDRPRAVPDFFADGRQVVTVEPSGKQTKEWEAAVPNISPGWEVTGGLILSWLQKTPNGDFISNPPPGMKIIWSIGPRTVWHGLKVREVRGQISHEGQPGTLMGSFFLGASSPTLVGQEADMGGPRGGKPGYTLYTHQKENPVLPAALGTAP